MQEFRKQIVSIVLGSNHSAIFLLVEILIFFVELIFFDPSEIGVLGLTWRVTLLSRCGQKLLVFNICVQCCNT